MDARQLADTLQAYQREIDGQTARANRAYDALILLAREFAFQSIEELKARGVELRGLAPMALLDLIRSSLAEQRLVARGSTDIPRRVAELSEERTHLSLELKRQIKQAQELNDRNQQLQRQMRSQRQTLEDRERELKEARDQIDSFWAHRAVEGVAGRASASPGSSATAGQISLLEGDAGQLGLQAGEDYPAWYWKWRTNSSYEHDLGLLNALGATGYCRLTEVRDEFELRGYGTESTLYRAVSSCERWELVERVGKVARTKGRPTSVITLTERGKWCYQKETGLAPKRNEYETLIKAHKHPDYLALIPQTAQAFERRGFEVDREPRRIAVDKDRGSISFLTSP